MKSLSQLLIRQDQSDQQLSSPLCDAIPVENEEKKRLSSQSSTIKVVILGVSHGLIAVHIIGNGIIMSSLGSHEKAAGTLIGSIQGVIVGTIFGFLSSTGTKLGATLGAAAAKKQLTTDEQINLQREMGAIIKTSWVLGAGMTLLGTICFISTPIILPLIVASPDTGKAAGNYFLGVAIGSFAESIGASNRIILTQIEKAIWTSVFITALQRLPPIALSYWWLAPKYGALGVGIATSIPNITALLVNQTLFFRSPYNNMQLYHCSIPGYKEHRNALLSDGWKLALQRISEWGNLMGITLVMGAWKDSSLAAYQPAMQANNLIGMILQGAAQAAMNFVMEDCKKQKTHYIEFKKTRDLRELEEFKASISLNKFTFIKNNLAGIGLAACFSVLIYFTRHYIYSVFLDLNSEPDQEDLAEDCLTLTIVGLIPDALRIVSGGLLRGWDDLLYPTLINFIMMTVVGVSVGAVVGEYKDRDVCYLLWARIITILLSTIYNFYRFYVHMSRDNQLYLDGEDWLKIISALEKWDNSSQIIVIKDDEVNEDAEAKLIDNLSKLNLYIAEGVDNGLFAAVTSTLAEYKEITKESLINSVADYLISHKKDIYKYSQELTDSIESKADYANDAILQGLAVALKINIVVIDNCNNISIAKTALSDRPILYIGYDHQEKKYYTLSGNPNINLLEFPKARNIALKKINSAPFGNNRGYNYSSFLVAQGERASISRNNSSRNLQSMDDPITAPEIARSRSNSRSFNS